MYHEATQNEAQQMCFGWNEARCYCEVDTGKGIERNPLVYDALTQIVAL